MPVKKEKRAESINVRVKPSVKVLIEQTRQAIQTKVQSNFPKPLQPIISDTDSDILEVLLIAGHEIIMAYLNRQRPEEIERLLEAYKNDTLKDVLFNEVSQRDRYAIFKVLSEEFNNHDLKISAMERSYKV